MKAAVLAAAMLALTACGNVGYVVETYSAKNRTFVEKDGATWWVYDRPDLGRVMVNAPIGAAAVSGATFGAVEPQYPAFAAVADQFLKAGGRTCAIGTGTEVVTNQVEFPYTCQ